MIKWAKLTLNLKLLIATMAVASMFFVPSDILADTAWTRHTIDNSSSGADGIRMLDVNGDGFLDMAVSFEEGQTSKAFIHPGLGNVTGTWSRVGFSVINPEDAVFADLDGNGQFDIISSSQNGVGGRRIFISWAPDSFANYLTASAWTTESITDSIDLSRWIYSTPYQLDGENGIDIISGASNFNGVIDNSQIVWFESPANPRNMDDWTYHKISDNAWTMSLMMSDMDGDGDDDVVTSDRDGARWLENPGHGPDLENEWTSHQIMTGPTTVFMGLGDLDEDGLMDAVNIVNAAPDTIVFSKRLDATGENWQNYTITMPTQAGNDGKGIRIADINLDGQNDLAITTNQVSGKEGVFWLAYPVSPTDANWEYHEISGRDGGVKFDDVTLYDVDADGDLDLFSTEETTNLGVIWYENPFANRPRSMSAPQICNTTSPGTKTPWLYAAVPQSSTSMLLKFTQAADPVDHYVLEYGTKSGEYKWSAGNIGNKDAREYLVKSLLPNTKYYFRIRAGNGCAVGGWSNEISAITKPALGFSELDITESNLETTSADESGFEETEQSSQISSYTVNVKIIDVVGDPVEGAKVTIHSKVQEAFTNKDGVVVFTDVEKGDHKVLVAYDGFEGEQSLNLTGETKEINLNITVEQKNFVLPTPWLIAICLMAGIILVFLFLLMKKAKANK